MPSREFVEVAAGVWVATSSRYVTTSTVVRSGRRAMLVDPAWTSDEMIAIGDWLAAAEVEVGSGVSTHAHFDHVLWQPGFGDVPRWASERTVKYCGEWQEELTGMAGAELLPGWPDPVMGLRAVVGEQVPDPFGDGGGEEVRFVVHDAHAPGHTAVHLADRGVLLAGDMLSDVELPLPFNPDDLPAYLAGLDALAPVVASVRVLVPGHGHPTARPIERLDADRRYLDALLRGEEPDDPRRALPGMAEAHSKMLAMARDLRA